MREEERKGGSERHHAPRSAEQDAHVCRVRLNTVYLIYLNHVNKFIKYVTTLSTAICVRVGSCARVRTPATTTPLGARVVPPPLAPFPGRPANSAIHLEFATTFFFFFYVHRGIKPR